MKSLPLRVFRCEPYRALLTPASCAARRAAALRTHRASPGKGTRLAASYCADCAIGAEHARGVDAAGVEYLHRDLGSPLPASAIPRRPPPLIPNALRALPEREEKPPVPKPTPDKTCAHPGCDATFRPNRNAVYCEPHRSREAAAERMKLRNNLNAAFDAAQGSGSPFAFGPPSIEERAAPAAPAATDASEPEPESDEAVRRGSFERSAAWAERRRARAAAGWVADWELDQTELAKAIADDVLEADLAHGEGWVPWRWILDRRTDTARGLRNCIARAKEAVGEEWTKDRPLDEAITQKVEDASRRAVIGHARGASKDSGVEVDLTPEGLARAFAEVTVANAALVFDDPKSPEALLYEALREAERLRSRIEELERDLDEARSEPRVDPDELLRACGFRVTRYAGSNASDVVLRVESGEVCGG